MPLRIENPVNSPKVPPMRESWETKFVFAERVTLSNDPALKKMFTICRKIKSLYFFPKGLRCLLIYGAIDHDEILCEKSSFSRQNL